MELGMFYRRFELFSSFCFVILVLMFSKGWCLMCKCDYHCPDNHLNFTCETDGKCFTQIKEDENFELQTTRGCLNHDKNGGNFQCNAKKHSKPTALVCCSEEDMCNIDLVPTLSPGSLYINQQNQQIRRESKAEYNRTPNIALVVSITVCTVMLVIVFAYFYFRHRQLRLRKRYDAERQIIIREGTLPVGSLRELLDSSVASGSGGVPLLIQRTIARQIHMQFAIGKGHCSEVWKARWQGEEVAVKVFNAKEEALWYREAEFYQTVLLRHDHVLGFIAADIHDAGAGTQCLLITAYHKHGSLYDFLRSHTYDHKIMMRLAHSLISGLSYLHREVCGMKGKPGIAHRNLKSKNILIKDNLTCAIGDLGLAVKLVSETKELDVGSSSRSPTRRYMAPELLDGSFDANHFDSHKQADMYSCGLVLWEIARRCQTGGFAEEYQLPYYDRLSNDPSLEEMRKTVVVEMRRPYIPNRWNTDQHLKFLVKLMAECWRPAPVARLTALRVKKNLQKFYSSDEHEYANEHQTDINYM